MEKPKHFLVYCGSPGIGKTYFCASLIEWALSSFKSFRYWNESELFKKVRASMEEYKGDYLEALKYMIDDQLVMLDDVGSMGLNEWRKEVIFDAIDERYNTTLPTVITTNYTSKEIKDFFHPRVYSRLFAKENIVIEINDGIDQRLN